MRQRDLFLGGEGDAWFRRNKRVVAGGVAADDPVLAAVRRISSVSPVRAVLEIGCGAGQRSAAIAAETGASVSGIDPSSEAVAYARGLGVDAHVATADTLPFGMGHFDLVLFGFCLYLCDRNDLFRIASEADRVLASPGWLLIHDFFAPEPISKPYHHRQGVTSFKMDYRRLFDWHPSYACLSHDVHDHSTGAITDEKAEWVALSVLRKTDPDA